VDLDAIDDILGPYGRLARALPGYEHRPQQLAMARQVAAALGEQRALLVEAGTGTGKTLAYLVPAILSGKRVVVSTGTKHLQEQILEKDIPLLRDTVGLPVEAAVLKGISNYLCLRRFSEVGDTADPDLVKIATWADRTATGDRGELAEVPDESPAWKLVTTTPDARLGPRCPFFERCFVTRARRAAAKAQIVIVNHHLFFADLALRAAYPGAAVLPPYQAVIFDEAHQVEDVATEHFGIGASTLRLLALGRDARKALTQVTGIGSAVPTGPAAALAASGQADARAAALMIGNLETRGDAFFALVRARLEKAGAGGDARVAMPADLFDDPARKDAWFRFDAALEEVAAHADRRALDLARDPDAAEDQHEDAAAVARRARAFRDDLGTLAEPAGTRKHVRWAEVRGRTVLLHASPIDIAPLLRETVMAGAESVTFTSATLTAGGSFDYARERLGLPVEDAEELQVDSPFDYAKQALLYLPRDLPAPQAPGFGEAVVARTAELCAISEGRAFVLFTSHRALRAAAVGLRQVLPWPVLVQGEAPRAALIDAFRARPGSVLLATSSFWEGVDVPGEALSLVVIEKLPFAAPDDPITAARVARLDERGEDAFRAYQVPRAAIALKQGFGRLIRRKDDRGIVAILDHRILTKGYGQLFLQSLPPAARTSAIEQVRRWWASGSLRA
jgi:ATP-dependent DNA helicase DinG